MVLSGLGACGMSSLTSGIGGGWFGNKKSTNAEVGSVNEDQLLAAAKTDNAGIAGRASAARSRTAVRAFRCGRATAT